VKYYRGLMVPLTVLCLTVLLALRRPLAIDEYLHLHWASEAARGNFAGTDYFSVHFTFLQFVFAPFFLFASSTPEVAIPWCRALMAVMLTFAVYVVSRDISSTISRKNNSDVSWLCAGGIVAGCGSLSSRLIEVRPDNVAIFFIVMACWLISSRFRQNSGRTKLRYAVVSGLLFGLAVLSSEKTFVVLATLSVVGLFLMPLRSRSFQGQGLVVVAAAGALVACCAIILALMSRGEFSGLMKFGSMWVEYARLHEKPGFWPRKSMFGEEKLLFYSLALIWFALSIRLRKIDVWQIMGLAGFLIYAVQEAPFEYSRNWLFVFAGPLLFFSLPFDRGSGMAALVLALAGWNVFSQDIHSRQKQLDVLRVVREISEPGDCVYDNSGGGVFRRHAHDSHASTDAMIRRQFVRQLDDEIPAAIRDRGCVIMLVDLRTLDLRGQLAAYLASHFVPVNPYMYFYSDHALPVSGSNFAEFFAPRAGWYHFVDRPSVPPIRLNKGLNRVDGVTGPVRLMWNPGPDRWPVYPGPMDVRGFSRL